MFEDSTFETTGRIRTRSRGWMIAALLFNSSILLALVLIPLIYPQALPHQMIAFLMEAPVPPAESQPGRPQPAHATPTPTRALEDPFQAPRQIPNSIAILERPDAPLNIADPGPEIGVPGGIGPSLPSLPGRTVLPTVRPAAKAPVRVPSSMVEGLLVLKTLPLYPPIARASRTEGTVVLAATISKTGTIENLRVVSGSAMLQQAALDAVKTWRYRPYLLNGEPVEVETTVNVNFRLEQ
ncbi:MAG: TonB family protein [Terracidiphilus sp.]